MKIVAVSKVKDILWYLGTERRTLFTRVGKFNVFYRTISRVNIVAGCKVKDIGVFSNKLRVTLINMRIYHHTDL